MMVPRKQYLQLAIQKSISDLLAEARQGYMGFLWWVIEPALYLSVFYFIFVVVFERGGKDDVAFLLIGLVIWKWFGSSIPKCSNSISANVGLIRQIYIPKAVIPVMTVLTTTFKFLIILSLLLALLLLLDYSVVSAWLSIPVLVLVQFITILSIGNFLASLVPFFPDLKFIIDNAMLLLFFLSGVFFDFSSVSPEIKFYLNLNPMLGIIDSYRDVLIYGRWPDWVLVGNISLLSLVLLVLGYYMLIKFDRVYPKIL